MHKLTAPNCAHNFELVTAAQCSLVKFAARHDFAIAFNGKAPALQTELIDELVNRQLGVFEASRISVDSKLNQLN